MRQTWITRLTGVLLVAGACASPLMADDAKIDLTASDVQGQALKVPAAGRPTLLIFVRTDQPQSQKAMEQIRAIIKDAKTLQVIAVVSGDQAPVTAGQLAKDPQWALPVVSDPDYQVSGKLNVCAWPTTLVVTGGGELVAHIGGFPASFATDLAANLDFAAGKIDRATLTQRTKEHDVIADSTDQKAGRHLQVAARLLEQAMPDAAKVELAKALEYTPNDAALQLSAAHLLLATGQVKESQAMLDKIGAGAISAPQIDLLRGRIALLQEKWDDAQRLLTAATRLNPDPAEAYYSLGLVYQHKQDWPHASEAFQKAYENTPQGRTGPAGK